MIRFVWLFLIVVVSLHAISDSEILKRADSLMKSGKKSDQFRAYNDYKNLYLRSMISEDESMRYATLKGIVRSGNSLHIDVSKYSKELSKFKSTKPAPNTNTSKPAHHTTDSKKSIKITSSHKLKSIKFKDDLLVMEFDRALGPKQLNYFTLHNPKKNQYRYVFDVHASMITSSHTLRKNGIKRIKLAQFNPKTIRLVIEDNEKLNVHFKKENNKVLIRILQKNGASESAKTTPRRLDRSKTIVIDAGHGGKDPGAIGYRRYREKIVVFQIAKELNSILKSRGYKVYMTRTRDHFVKLSNRTKFANKKGADIFISIHANAISKKNARKVSGIECYFLSKSRSSRAKRVAAKENSADLSDMNYYGKEALLSTINSHNIVASNKLAIDLQRGMLGNLKKHYKHVKDGGVREGPFWVLVGAQMPSVLIEVGFISHPTEARRLVNSRYQKRMALGMADGIERYFANN